MLLFLLTCIEKSGRDCNVQVKRLRVAKKKSFFLLILLIELYSCFCFKTSEFYCTRKHGKQGHCWSCAPRHKEPCFELSIKVKQAKEHSGCYEFSIEHCDVSHSGGELQGTKFSGIHI